MSEKVVEKVPGRDEVAEGLKWDLSPVYADAAAWEADFARLEEVGAPVAAMEGKLDGAAAALELFRAEEALDRLLEKLYTFAHLKHDEDTAAAEGQEREDRIRTAYAEWAARCAWITPELASKSEEELRAWADWPGMGPWKRRLEKIVRNKPHVLSAEVETALARVSDVLGAPEQIYSLLTEADMAFPPARDGEGKDHELTEGTYRTLLESGDRALRESAFETLLGGYGKVRHVVAATLAGTVKEHAIDASMRHFGSSLEAALFDDRISTGVYNGLIDAAHGALPSFRRYLALRARKLGLEGDLRMWDVYVPLAGEEEDRVPPAEARAWVEAACAPLGEEYGGILGRAFGERWIDWRENKGKATGAYSSGCYDTAPYLLLNSKDRLDDAFTLAHELGHSVHSFLARAAQPHATAEYPIFLAEIASTVNELLLSRHLLSLDRGKAFRVRVLNHLCDQFKGTVFRQVMFAEFERDIHAAVEEGQPLSADWLCGRYGELNDVYYGPVVAKGGAIELEWARIPHFYYDFYVYKYATSFCAALVFARRIREGKGVEGYLDLLRGGGSKDPLEALSEAGVDLSRPEVVAAAFAEFGQVLDAFEAELGEA